MSKRPIFYDSTQRRASRVEWIGRGAALLSTLVGTAFIASILIFHKPPELQLPARQLQTSGSEIDRTARVRHLLPAMRGLAMEAFAARQQSSVKPELEPASTAEKPASGTLDGQPHPLTVGFVVDWDPTSLASLKRHLDQLDWVVPNWFTLKGETSELDVQLDREMLDHVRRTKPSAKILPLLQNVSGESWHGDDLARMLANPAIRQARIAEIAEVLADNKLSGLFVDFEEVPQKAQPDLLSFVKELKAAFSPHGWIVAVAAPFEDADWDYRAYSQASDYLALMAYDEHWESGEPGSIASQDWFQKCLDKRMRVLPSERTIIALGAYGYDWEDKSSADDLTFQEVMDIARESKASIKFDPTTLNPGFSYKDDTDTTHQVAFLDAVTLHNQIQAANAYRPAGFALWRLGAEDPSVWQVLGRTSQRPGLPRIEAIEAGDDVNYSGEGEILQVASEAKDGARSIDAVSGSGIITQETYKTLPSSFELKRGGFKPNSVALTFDDGPSSDWTPKILDILAEKNVHATFFVVGENGLSRPDLLKRIVDEGHELGNHTFTHPNLADTSAETTVVELNATQRLVEAVTGRSMRMFRPPYLGDAEPQTAGEIAAIKVAQSLGYNIIGLKVDPDDWQEPTAGTIVERVLDQVGNSDAEERGQVVLLHDAGGNRANTVAALPALIDALRAKGYNIVTVSQLAGWSRDQVMPPVPVDVMTRSLDLAVFDGISWTEFGLHWLVVMAIALGLLRLLVLCGLAMWHKLRETSPPASDGCPGVSVLIPAYNEEKVIVASVRRILESRHNELEVIVIDDGSKDRTAEKVREAFGNDSRVHLLCIPNGGKANAVNAGLEHTTGEIVVALDADTQFEPETIPRLARWFADEQVGAVAGNAKVGNRINVLTKWQALEYITAQNLERRALAALDCITVVPGAVGAWRRSVLCELGGFPADTLAEDQDLTIAVQRAGYRAVFDSEAVAWTEAPDTLGGLARQRYRWAFGTLQCLWKHGRALFNSSHKVLGFVALPQVWLFQIFLSLLSPLIDLILLFQILTTSLDYMHHGSSYDPSALEITLFYYGLFMAVDLGASVIAFAFEKGERWRLLWWLVLQRFGYRQIMYYVVLKSVVSAIKGRFVGWGKLDRKATVTVGSKA